MGDGGELFSVMLLKISEEQVLARLQTTGVWREISLNVNA